MRYLLFLLFVTISIQLIGQTDSLRYKMVEKTVRSFFLSMKESDSTLLRSTLDPELRLQTVYKSRSTGEPAMHFGDPEEFVEAVGKSKSEGQEWNEVIDDLQIQIDADLAQVWMTYEFYLGDQFSHCGVNAMQLFWNGSNWKIFQITDTRRITCD